MKKSLHHSTIITLLFLLLLSVTACKDTDELPDETPTVPDTDIAVVQDTAVKPTGGKASECQPGQDIDNTWDGKFSSDGGVPYHSVWNQSAAFPVTLEYYFEEGTEIDYLIYYTRSGNGNFGELDLLIATDAEHSDWKPYGSYNFRMQNAPSKITFKETQKLTGIRFVVKSGAGNFVSCDEMEFYRYNQQNDLEKQLLGVFSDITCSGLKEGVTEKEINALPEYFAALAKALRDNTYDSHEREFRIRTYAPYSIAEEWAEKLMTRKYGNLDNPTGISVQEGDEIMVLVGDTHGQQISLQSIWESGEEYRQTNVSGDIYFLRPGVNKLTMRNQGQLFVMYNTDLTAPEAQPVKIHILPGSGTVTGFFDLKEHQTDEKYAELLSKATHQGEDTEIHMRMNWQLWNYYHRCGHKKDFWQTLFKLLRADRIVESDPGAAQLKFAMRASEAAGEDLTDFFDLWGFFIPGEDTIDQYGTWNYRVTEAMIQEAKDYMKQFPKPKHAFQYIEDRKEGDTGLDITAPDTGYYTQFEGDVKPVSTAVCHTVSGRTYTVTNGENAVAFELRKGGADGELVYFFNRFSYTIPEGVDLTGTGLFAVQADGKRIEVPRQK